MYNVHVQCTSRVQLTWIRFWIIIENWAESEYQAESNLDQYVIHANTIWVNFLDRVRKSTHFANKTLQKLTPFLS